MFIKNWQHIRHEYIKIWEWELVSLNRITLFIPFLLDKIRLTFSIVVLIISFRVIIFRASYMSGDKNLFYFIVIVLIFILSINLLIFIPNIISLILGWDGLGLSSYLLVIYYLNEKSLRAGIITALTNRIGDSLLVLARSWAIMSGHWNLFLRSFSVASFIAISVIIAAITKRAQLPFSAWLPAAIAAPTPVSALVHSSTLVTAGIYLTIRFFPSLSLFSPFYNICLYTGIITCFIARLAAALENDLKKVIALSTLRQLGVIIIALGLNQPILAFFHLVTHALFKALLFICAGNIIHRIKNNQDLRLIGNISELIPITTMTLNVANISLCGLPFLAGFYSKDIIGEIFIHSHRSILTRVLVILSICLTSLYTIKLSLYTLWSPYKGHRLVTKTDQRKVSIPAYTVLLTGAITRGTVFSWLLRPSIELVTLPTPLKLLILIIISLFAFIRVMIFKFNIFIPSQHFFSSIWFLKFISSSPIIQTSSFVRKIVTYNELTWIESLRGLGLKDTIKRNTQKAQKIANISISSIISSMAFISIVIALYLL